LEGPKKSVAIIIFISNGGWVAVLVSIVWDISISRKTIWIVVVAV
jgi:hypothetical protein